VTPDFVKQCIEAKLSCRGGGQDIPPPQRGDIEGQNDEKDALSNIVQKTLEADKRDALDVARQEIHSLRVAVAHLQKKTSELQQINAAKETILQKLLANRQSS